MCGEENDVSEPDGVCPECEAETIDGIAIKNCFYSPIICEVCQDAPCDGSC